MDNKAVTLLSTFAGSPPTSEATCWNRKTSAYEKISCPNIVSVYNKHMGGVDLIDLLIGLYRNKIRSKKWYHRLFFHMVDMTVINAWLLYRRQLLASESSVKAMSLHEFKADLAEALCRNTSNVPTTSKHGRPTSDVGNGAPSSKKSKESGPEAQPCIDVQFDGMNHWPRLTEKIIRCEKPLCLGKSRIRCVKCQAHLCLIGKKKIFAAFYTK
jgi:Transposase IS4